MQMPRTRGVPMPAPFLPALDAPRSSSSMAAGELPSLDTMLEGEGLHAALLCCHAVHFELGVVLRSWGDEGDLPEGTMACADCYWARRTSDGGVMSDVWSAELTRSAFTWSRLFAPADASEAGVTYPAPRKGHVAVVIPAPEPLLVRHPNATGTLGTLKCIARQTPHHVAKL